MSDKTYMEIKTKVSAYVEDVDGQLGYTIYYEFIDTDHVLINIETRKATIAFDFVCTAKIIEALQAVDADARRYNELQKALEAEGE